jgi:hypothetical protein
MGGWLSNEPACCSSSLGLNPDISQKYICAKEANEWQLATHSSPQKKNLKVQRERIKVFLIVLLLLSRKIKQFFKKRYYSSQAI